ncbi:branched-chain amino acid ABC transporter permease [Elioraea sp.]|uniref:branched-chain amino acid ABC transporter permease n=1 Tax=Elioraea sp. TaxID=2185103 RepID=UPI0021DF3BB1|nr:branched-chain amino acid ABC transporter permease [Elioraea sp.]GIX09938.1 MAG: branched-chain amino acid ABC transporter permease [Elioraea sp.]
MTNTLHYLLAGLSIGSVYGMIALGFAVMWHAAKAVNFSYGTLFMLGGVLTVAFTWWGLPLLLAGLGAIAAAVVAAAVIERAFVRPFNREANAIGWMLTTIAAGVMIESATTATYGSLGHPLPSPLVQEPLRIAGAGIYPQELLLPATLIGITTALELVYRRTMLGRALRAVAFNRAAAGLVGIDADRITLIAFAIAGFIGALAGFLVAPVVQASSTMGMVVGLKGFLVAIVAGIDNTRGVVLVGVLFGMLEKFLEGYVSTAGRDAIAFTAMILALLFFPQGLFGRRVMQKV